MGTAPAPRPDPAGVHLPGGGVGGPEPDDLVALMLINEAWYASVDGSDPDEVKRMKELAESARAAHLLLAGST
jgi:hypothetical protein